ncbi:MAG: hypothetical protein JST75_22265 [Bacteroidetes bacterium]|nr:hypothetical protein [Bacteroidota bacterium]
MKALVLVLAIAIPGLLTAQRIVYSSPESDDGRRTNFEIIGKVGGNVLVFKNNRNLDVISVYDNSMKLIQRVPQDFLPEKYINIDFVQYPDFCYMIYEYQKKNIVHCSAVKIDGNGKRISEPVDLDTTQINSSSNKIYTTIYSEDKQHIMVFKINSKNPKNYVFTTFLFDKQLELIDRHRINITMEEKNEMFTNFLLDNDGQLVFAKFLKNNSSGDYISRAVMVTKGPTSDTFAIRDVGTNDKVLDEIKLKVDNNNKRYILTGFYYKQKRGNIEGLYVMVWDKTTDTKLKETLTVFNEELRALAKSSEANLKMAFNDFFIKNIIVKKDGGYLLVSESEYTTTRGSAFNRWDYMYGYGYNPWMSPLDYYSPYNPYSPYGRYGYGGVPTRYNAENILVLSFDKDGNLEWSNVIPKSQYDDESDNLISHHIVNTGGELHFLYNQYERRTLLLSDQSISPEGKLTRNPTLRNLDKGYDFMPRYGKQISSNQILIPCLYRNYLCFAKIDF